MNERRRFGVPANIFAVKLVVAGVREASRRELDRVTIANIRAHDKSRVGRRNRRLVERVANARSRICDHQTVNSPVFTLVQLVLGLKTIFDYANTKAAKSKFAHFAKTNLKRPYELRRVCNTRKAKIERLMGGRKSRAAGLRVVTCHLVIVDAAAACDRLLSLCRRRSLNVDPMLVRRGALRVDIARRQRVAKVDAVAMSAAAVVVGRVAHVQCGARTSLAVRVFARNQI